MDYRLLGAFQNLFERHPYLHRSSRLGDWVAMHLYEDLHSLAKSDKLKQRIETRARVLSTANVRRGVKARRGDGSFGDLVPGTPSVEDEGFAVARGETATIEIGVEVKILAKAMIKQIDRVINDLHAQAGHFRIRGGNPICVGIVGINFAAQYTSFEGKRRYKTDGKKYPHPMREAEQAERRVLESARSHFDEFVILRFRATNTRPYPFEWLKYGETAKDYGAALVRVSDLYERRF